MKYPLIKKFLNGLKIYEFTNEDFILASDLEAELAKGVQYYGYFEDTYELYNTKDNAKYEGLVIGYQRIENREPVSKDELISQLSKYSHKWDIEMLDIIERIKKNGVR